MSRLRVRILPDGRRAEVFQDRPDLVRVMFYEAGTGRISASYELHSVDAAMAMVRRWVNGAERDERRSPAM